MFITIRHLHYITLDQVPTIKLYDNVHHVFIEYDNAHFILVNMNIKVPKLSMAIYKCHNINNNINDRTIKCYDFLVVVYF